MVTGLVFFFIGFVLFFEWVGLGSFSEVFITLTSYGISLGSYQETIEAIARH